MSNSSSRSSGIGFLGLLLLVFITLKLIGEITWPWIWVLSPIWGVAAIIFIILGLILLLAFIKALFRIK